MANLLIDMTQQQHFKVIIAAAVIWNIIDKSRRQFLFPTGTQTPEK